MTSYGFEPAPESDDGSEGEFDHSDRHHRTHTSTNFQIFVRNLDGRNITYIVNKEMTVLELKRLIQQRQGISVDQQRLVFNGQQLDKHDRWGNPRTLGYYNITRDSTIELMGRLRGG